MSILKLSLTIIFLLIDQGISLPSILGAVSTIMIALLGYFLKDAYSRLIERIRDAVIRIKELEVKVEKNEDKINVISNKTDEKITNLNFKMDSEMRSMDGKLGDLRFNIIEKLELIKDKVNEARK